MGPDMTAYARIGRLEEKLDGQESVLQNISYRLSQIEKALPKPMTAREAYDDALNAIAQIMSEPLTSLSIGNLGSTSAIISDIVGEIKSRRDRKARD
jgi:uncharacterized coiled-coil protein SlyX